MCNLRWVGFCELTTEVLAVTCAAKTWGMSKERYWPYANELNICKICADGRVKFAGVRHGISVK